MTEFLILAFLFLAAGAVAVPLASRLGLGSVLGYLVAGIVIGPALDTLGVDVVSIQHFAEFGVVMMLFIVGLELEPSKLWSMRMRLLGLGGFQVIATALLISSALLFLGQAWETALTVGLILSLSSTAIVLQTLNEKKWLGTEGGQASFSVLLFQDIAVIPMLAVIPLLAIHDLVADEPTGSPSHEADYNLIASLDGWHQAGATIAAIAIIVIIGNYLSRPIFRYIASAGLRELFVATALITVIGMALLMTFVGLSPALGAFLGGVVLANSEYRHELESDITPFRGLLLGLFFITIGASIDFGLLKSEFELIFLATISLLLIKVVVLLVVSFVFKINKQDRWLFCLGMAQAGEFGFVLLSFSVANHVMPQGLADQLLLVVAMSMLLTPMLFIFYDKVIVTHFNKSQGGEPDEFEESSGVIIAGHGRFGSVVDRMLRAGGFGTTVLDYDAANLDVLRQFGIRAFFGDATRPDLLQSAGIQNARVLVITLNERDQISALAAYVKKTFPHVAVIARAIDHTHDHDLKLIGCDAVVRETLAASIEIGTLAFERLGVPVDQALEYGRIFSEEETSFLDAMSQYHEMNRAPLENELYLAKAQEMLDEHVNRLQSRFGAGISETNASDAKSSPD
ncbi:MAG: cation:proton antiporter [Pseudomonadales bacterium]|nr:cation:proton antiporter [Pseudomonadales bacterium]